MKTRGGAGLSVTVIGAGLAGCEAAWQLLSQGLPVTLLDMKPRDLSPAHRSPRMAELVCSNSFRSDSPDSAAGLLKEELSRMDSLIMRAARDTRVPAGKALAVDRELFSRFVEETLRAHGSLSVRQEQVRNIPRERPLIIATGPLTSEELALSIAGVTGAKSLFFYDAISPVIESDSIDYSKVFRASRYEEGAGDYINCPLNSDTYEALVKSIRDGDEVPLRDFEDRKCFEGCLPLEVMVRRNHETPRYGPMKPVGLKDPRTGRQPWAVVQLRRENNEGTLYSMVGFQTKLTRPEQKRIFRMIPGLENAEFARYGSIHRNTYIDSPTLLEPSLELKGHGGLFFAGQITGVEGYIESAAMGLLAGINAGALARRGFMPPPPPPETALGSLIRHLGTRTGAAFQPMNVNFGLFPPLPGRIPRKERGRHYARRSLEHLARWQEHAKD
ncbi:MAG: methylenetetrahydrofolate--tRNA-(uracil(54)-C(5))-methyltransferase (FADH(2)-oxidizing) TrmFO [Syntrophales bacterium]|nr:methylenetetrahydrofolate--tRNA-(uracil(54)-C(5))-methyltransferase (FADH(2)-oxidizing) TrmFO [Syntrophales bacterium]